MARYNGPLCRLCRREGNKLLLKGTRCYTGKCAMERSENRSGPPGPPSRSRKKISQYGIQLREKQKLKRIYRLQERQFRRYFHIAEQQKGITGENFLGLLECRLDNAVYRLGFASSRNQARQMVSHGHFLVNGRKVNIPSYLLRPVDEIVLKENSRENPLFKQSLASAAGRAIPQWLKMDADNFKGTVLSRPSREEIDTQVKEELIVEFYSR